MGDPFDLVYLAFVLSGVPGIIGIFAGIGLWRKATSGD